MDHPFSIDEVPSDILWTPQPPIPQVPGGDAGADTPTATAGLHDDAATDWSPSEWSFKTLLEEELLENTTPPAADSSSDPVLQVEEEEPAIPGDAAEVEPATVAAMANPFEYNAMLKRKLEEDLAIIAMWRASSTAHEENSQGSSAYNGGNMNPAQDELIRDGSGHLAQDSCAIARQPAAHSSSANPSLSDDDDMDGEVATRRRFRRPEAERLTKRKQSNRESARRSRTRKAAHMKDLQDQVSHLRVENSLLLKRLDSLNQRYNACAVDNRILRADMETLRTQVRLAEETLNRFMGTNSLSFRGTPFVATPSPATLPADPPAPVVPIQNHNVTNNYYTAGTGAAAHNARVSINHGGSGSGSYMQMPRAAATPSPLQAASVAAVVGNVNNNGRSGTEAIHAAAAAASLSATAAMELRLRERASAMPMPMPSSSAAVAASPANGSAPLGLNDDDITDGADMEAFWDDDDDPLAVSMDDIWGDLN